MSHCQYCRQEIFGSDHACNGLYNGQQPTRPSYMGLGSSLQWLGSSATEERICNQLDRIESMLIKLLQDNDSCAEETE